VVDDQLDAALLIKRVLERNGWNVKEFTDPVLALNYVREHSMNYDAVLSDIRMPGISGFELVKSAKAVNPEIKIFLMTAFEIRIAEMKKVLPSVEVDGLIEKPVSMTMLVSLIEKGTMAPRRNYHGFEVQGDEFVSLDYG